MMKHKSFFSHLMAFACGMLLLMPLNGYTQQSVRGDVNDSGVVDIDDVNAVINIMLHKADPAAGSDVNGDGSVDIGDLNIIINVMLGKDGSGSHGDGDWVDLGLPSGTLWATRNIGADKPEDYGDYFAWGETAPKETYDRITYKWWKQGYTDAHDDWHSDGWTKYSYDPSYGYDGYYGNNYKGFVDRKTELDFDDDAAAANWGGSVRMPSREQIQELVDNCTWQWTQRNGVNGRLGTGSNGTTIFLPAAGHRLHGSLYSAGDRGDYWSRRLYADYSFGADYMFVGSGRHYWDDIGIRYYGHTVRAVRVP